MPDDFKNPPPPPPPVPEGSQDGTSGAAVAPEGVQAAEGSSDSEVEELRQKLAARDDEAETLKRNLLEALAVEYSREILADPTDLLVHVDADDLLDDDGRPDGVKIKAAADDLVARKPHLSARRTAGDVGQGARPEAERFSLADALRARA